jgi:hypothetical protein
LAFLSLPQLCRAAKVCKDWQQLSLDPSLWRPIFEQLKLVTDKKLSGKEIKQIVLEKLQRHQKSVTWLVSLANDDPKLAPIIYNPAYPMREMPSLKELQAMLAIERTLHVMSAWKKDCVEFSEYLLTNFLRKVKELREQQGVAKMSDEKYLPLLFKLVETQPVHFNAARMMLDLFPCLSGPPEIQQKVFRIFASIVRSHHNLTDFLKADADLPDIEPVVMKMQDIIVPMMRAMATHDTAVTMSDWEQCGYTPST